MLRRGGDEPSGSKRAGDGRVGLEGYLRGFTVPEFWHIGDVGHSNDGNLVVDGRKDHLLVTPAGRNVTSEWVEARVNAEPRVAAQIIQSRAAIELRATQVEEV